MCPASMLDQECHSTLPPYSFILNKSAVGYCQGERAAREQRRQASVPNSSVSTDIPGLSGRSMDFNFKPLAVVTPVSSSRTF